MCVATELHLPVETIRNRHVTVSILFSDAKSSSLVAVPATVGAGVSARGSASEVGQRCPVASFHIACAHRYRPDHHVRGSLAPQGVHEKSQPSTEVHSPGGATGESAGPSHPSSVLHSARATLLTKE